MNSSFIKSFDILFAPYNYLTIGTIFKRFFFPEVFLYQFSKILSLEFRASLPEKHWTLLSLKHHLLHLLDYLFANYVISTLIPSWNCENTRRIHMYHALTLEGVKWHKGLFIVGCVIWKQSLQRLYMNIKSHDW